MGKISLEVRDKDFFRRYIMNTIAVKSSRDKIVVTFDKTESNVDILLKFLDRIDTEQSAKKIDFSDDILDIAGEIKSKWWQTNKKRFLKKKA